MISQSGSLGVILKLYQLAATLLLFHFTWMPIVQDLLRTSLQVYSALMHSFLNTSLGAELVLVIVSHLSIYEEGVPK